MKTHLGKKLALSLILLSCFGACLREVPGEPTPEAARQFLKLRGYEYDQPSFFRAAEAGDALAVNAFLKAGMNVNVKDSNDDTALTAAAARGDVQMVSTLIKGGADPNAKGRNNWTALLLSLKEERHEVAEALLALSNLDLKAETPEGMNALMLAVWHQRPDSARKLIQMGSNVNHQDKEGDASLHGAAWVGNMSLLGMLLDARANPNVKNKLGGTPLMWAASYGHDAAVRLLLEKGADPRIKDVDGVTAAGWAAKNKRGNLIMILLAAEKAATGKQ